MDYFELYQIPISLKIDKQFVQKKYYELCKLHHPDRYTLSDDEAQKNAETMLATINAGKVTLEHEDKCLDYLLTLKNIIEPDEKYVLSPIFLGEMVDINEQLMELEFEKNDAILDSIKIDISHKEKTLKESVQEIFEQAIFEPTAEQSNALKNYYYQKKYLNRIIEKLN